MRCMENDMKPETVRVWRDSTGMLCCDLDCGVVNPPVDLVHRGLCRAEWCPAPSAQEVTPAQEKKDVCPRCGSSAQVFTDRSGNYGCWRVGCGIPMLRPDGDKNEHHHPTKRPMWGGPVPTWELSVWPHPKFPLGMKSGPLPDRIMLRLHGDEVTGWRELTNEEKAKTP